MQRRPHRLARLREREGVLHLPEDLRLADHHGIQARGHAERVADRVVLGMDIEDGLDGCRVHAALPAQMAERGGARLARHLGDAVDLDAIARRQHHGLAQRAATHEVAQDLADLVLVGRQLLAQLDRRVLVAQPCSEERHQAPCRPGRNNPAPSVTTSAAKPMIAKYAARRPCQPPAARPASVPA